MEYTRAQRTAIRTIDQNLQIIACAGSGKTQVVSARIVEILRRKKTAGVTPANIVAFTFTEKAAAELKDRVHRLCQQELGTTQGLAEMFIGTMHAYCLNLLQSAPLYKYLKYTVLTEVQQRLLIDLYCAKSGLKQVLLLSGGYLKPGRDSSLYQSLLSVLGEGEVDQTAVPPEVWSARERYRELCQSKRLLDYTTIITEAVDQLRTNRVLRDRVAAEVKYLVVDEYQDTNPIQEALIRELHDLGANLCVVGDDDQTIYQWRGSDVGNILRFAKRYPRVKQVSLNENFRSSRDIVAAARSVIERNPAGGRLAKRMESTDAQPSHPGDVAALTFDDPEQEAAWIASQIKRLYGTRYEDRPGAKARGLSYSGFAVLVRARRDGELITQALKSAGIPYVVGGVSGLFDTEEARALRSVFFFLADFELGEDGPVTVRQLPKILAGAGLGLTKRQIQAGVALLKQRKAKIGDRTDAKLFLQRVFLDLLAALELREEAVDRANRGTSRTGEVVYYNLGKFSQVISDFEHINFHLPPSRLYEQFARFLHYQAPRYYSEGAEEASAAQPDAVQIMTVHQAKGMQWPVVFIPCLRQNRFPSRRHGGRSIWSVLPENCVADAERYKGTMEDERRLFYVAVTRAERYLYCTWAPIADNQQQRRESAFLAELRESGVVASRVRVGRMPRLKPEPRREETSLALTFSQLKYYFDCPYLFKLRFLYGFDTPVSRALGYGKSLHDALAEIHAEARRGRVFSTAEVERLVDDHLHLAFANDQVKENLRQAAREALTRYLAEHQAELRLVEHVEKVIELKLADGIVVNGRIDLIRRTDTGETVIVDFKSDERAQAESITESQLHVYAVGYEQLTGQRAACIEIHNLDKGGATRRALDDKLVNKTIQRIVEAGRNLNDNHLPRLDGRRCSKCRECDHVGICRSLA